MTGQDQQLRSCYLLALTCLHEQISRKSELFELTVKLTTPAGKQKSADTTSTIFQHPIDGSSSFALCAAMKGVYGWLVC